MSYRASSSPSGKAVVRRKTELTLEPLEVDVNEGDTVTFTGKLTEASGPNIGRGIPGKTIRFYVNGEEVTTATTAEDGSFSISYTWSTQGVYTFHVAYLGD